MKSFASRFRTLPILLAAGLLGGPLSTSGQWTSAYPRVSLAGDFNGWDTTSTNMVLIDHGVWQAYQSFPGQSSIAFQFSAENSPDTSTWRENDQTGFTPPLAAFAELAGTHDIIVSNTLHRTLRFQFSEATGHYRVEDVSPDFAPWINEVEYDNVGTDSNEWVEIAGPAGLSLSDHELVFINQVGSVYQSFDLTDASYTFEDEDEGVGYFIIGIARPGLVTADYTPEGWDVNVIQNGPSDSIQLRRIASQQNLHLIDYEGTNSTTVQDQVVTVGDDNGDDRTIYLTEGPGFAFPAFSWTNSILQETPGARNAGQRIASSAADVIIRDILPDPQSPGSGVPVTIEADLVATNAASNLVATAFYRTESSSPFVALPMVPAAGATWRTVDPIPGQPTGTVVEYYLFVAFDGVGSLAPALAPEDAPDSVLSVAIPRLPPGTIWLNEINYRFTFFSFAATNEYIELAGPAGSDLSDWQIQLFDTELNYASYTLPGGTRLPDDDAGYGFLVLGDAGVPHVDIVLTNVIAGDRSLTETGAIRLLNELGTVEYTFTYSSPQTSRYPNAEYIGNDDNSGSTDPSLGAIGTGSRYPDLTWAVNPTRSPGALNPGQTLTGGGTTPGIPDVEILSVHLVGTDLEIVSTGTNTWLVIGEYSTHLPGGESGWMPLQQISNTYADGANTTRFALPTATAPVMHFRIRQTTSGSPPPEVTIVDAGLVGTDIEIVSTGSENWRVIGEYSTSLLDRETEWMPLSQVSNAYANGTHTTRFGLPVTTAPGIHFRIRQTE